jgi:hypothetical protein
MIEEKCDIASCLVFGFFKNEENPQTWLPLKSYSKPLNINYIFNGC